MKLNRRVFMQSVAAVVASVGLATSVMRVPKDVLVGVDPAKPGGGDWVVYNVNQADEYRVRADPETSTRGLYGAEYSNAVVKRERSDGRAEMRGRIQSRLLRERSAKKNAIIEGSTFR